MLRPTSVRHHLAVMQARGFAPAAVLAGTGIDAARLADPVYLVEAGQCHAVVANMLRLSADPVLGLDIGAKTLITDLGIVGYAMASASTLGQAIGLWVQYGNSPIGFPFTLRLDNNEHTGEWGAVATPKGFSGDMFRFYVEETIAVGFALAPQLEGTSFQTVVDRFRCDLAREYLGPGMLPAKEVSYLLSFSNPNTFRSAFKAWTGQTIGTYLASLRR